MIRRRKELEVKVDFWIQAKKNPEIHKKIRDMYNKWRGDIRDVIDEGVEAGIFDMRQRIETGRLKVFNTMVMWREEYESYHRDEGKIDKNHDDLMDATRYLLSKMDTFKTKPVKRRTTVAPTPRFGDWM